MRAGTAGGCGDQPANQTSEVEVPLAEPGLAEPEPERAVGDARRDEPTASEAPARLRALAVDGPVTLLSATKELDLSQAAVLAGLLRDTRCRS